MKITKRVAGWIICTVLALVLTGCADHYPEYAKHQAGVDNNNKALIAQYFASQSSMNAVTAKAMSDKGDTTSLVLFAVLQGQQNAQIINAFKSNGLVAPTTGMDVANTFMGSTVPTFVKWGFGYLAADSLIETLGTSGATAYTIGGDYTNINSSMTAGDDIMSTITIDKSINNGIPSLPYNPQANQ